MKAMRKRLLSAVLCMAMAAGLAPALRAEVRAADPFEGYDYFLVQGSSGTCTLCSALMMFRRAAILNGEPDWDRFEEGAYFEDGSWWLKGIGLQNCFSDGDFKAQYVKLAPSEGEDAGAAPDHEGRKRLFIDLIGEHPEGIVIWLAYSSLANRSVRWHAVLLTRYDSATDTFYCADTSAEYANRELKLIDSILGTAQYIGMYTGRSSNTQEDILAYLRGYWYIYEGVRADAADADMEGESEADGAEGVHLPTVNRYTRGRFTDVSEDRWYADAVADAFTYGLMRGSSETTFNPDGNVTLAEAVTMAARIHSIYSTGTEDFDQSAGGAWYDTYLDYALAHDIIGAVYFHGDVTQNATRAQFAEIFARALPDAALAAVNDIPDGAIPDVAMSEDHAGAVYLLYRAGILTGSDGGAFRPQSFITRAEAAAIVSRMAESGSRVRFSL